MRKHVKKEPRRVNFILMDGGLGDHMGSLVVIDYTIKTYPWITPLVWVPNYLLEISKHLLPKGTHVKDYSSMPKNYNPHMTTKTTKWDGITSPMKLHTVDYAFMKLVDENPAISKKNYLKIKPELIDISKFNLSDKYIVITSGYTAKVREFPAKHINEIAKYAKSNGYEVVFLGQTKTETGSKHIIEGNFDKDVDFSVGWNLIDKTSLLEAAKIMHNSKAVIGVDNGLLHVAGCTDTAIVGGFTNVSPSIRMPIRNDVLGWNYYPVVPAESIGCCHCQQNTNFLYGHDYKQCVFKDNDCTELGMNSENFIKELSKIV